MNIPVTVKLEGQVYRRIDGVWIDERNLLVHRMLAAWLDVLSDPDSRRTLRRFVRGEVPGSSVSEAIEELSSPPAPGARGRTEPRR